MKRIVERRAHSDVPGYRTRKRRFSGDDFDNSGVFVQRFHPAVSFMMALWMCRDGECVKGDAELNARSRVRRRWLMMEADER